MITYLGYAAMFFLGLHAAFLGAAGAIIRGREPAPFKMSKTGIAFLIIIISVGFYKLNQILLFLFLTPFGSNISELGDQEAILIPLVLFQTLSLLGYAEARLSLGYRWEEKKLRDLQAELRSYSLASAQKQDEAKIWKASSEALSIELDSVKKANNKAHADYSELLRQKQELQEDVAFIERNATRQTIEELEKIRRDRKNLWVFDG